MKINHKISILGIIVLLLSGCANTDQVVQSSNQGQCDILRPAAQPKWVTGSSQIRGYYTGIGDSDASHPDAAQIARQRALADLSSSIQTKVSQQLNIQINQNSQEQVSQKKIKIHTRAITENSIKNGIRDGQWLDSQTCRLWMRIKVAKKDVEKMQHKNINKIRLQQAKQNYQTAADHTKSHAIRLEKVEDAIRLVEKTDFAILPLESKQKYAAKFRKMQQQILSQSGSNDIIIITLEEQATPRSVHKELAYRISKGLKQSKHIYPAPCAKTDDCLQYARSMRASRLIIIPLKTSTSTGGMGSKLGELTIDTILYDVESGRKLSHIQNQKGQVLSFDANNIAWEQAIERLFSNNTDIQKLRSTALKCSVQQC